MRINGRLLRPATLAERRLLLSLGTSTLRVPRGMNPFAVARRLKRAAQGVVADQALLKELVGAARGRTAPAPEARAS